MDTSNFSLQQTNLSPHRIEYFKAHMQGYQTFHKDLIIMKFRQRLGIARNFFITRAAICRLERILQIGPDRYNERAVKKVEELIEEFEALHALNKLFSDYAKQLTPDGKKSPVYFYDKSKLPENDSDLDDSELELELAEAAASSVNEPMDEEFSPSI